MLLAMARNSLPHNAALSWATGEDHSLDTTTFPQIPDLMYHQSDERRYNNGTASLLKVVSCPHPFTAQVCVTTMGSISEGPNWLLGESALGWGCCASSGSVIMSLLATSNLPTLKARWIITKLCYLAKTLHGTVHSSIPLPDPRNMDSRLWSFQDSLLFLPFLKTNFYKCSYPDSIALWNQLPPGVCASPSLRVFQRNLCALLLTLFLANCIICLCHLPLLLFFCWDWPRISVSLLPVPCSFSRKISFIAS